MMIVVCLSSYSDMDMDMDMWCVGVYVKLIINKLWKYCKIFSWNDKQIFIWYNFFLSFLYLFVCVIYSMHHVCNDKRWYFNREREEKKYALILIENDDGFIVITHCDFYLFIYFSNKYKNSQSLWLKGSVSGMKVKKNGLLITSGYILLTI